MQESQPIVAIIGRPNVGKSTLFNRLTDSRRAITADLPGTTRDRIYAEAEWQGTVFSLVDTGGLAGKGSDRLAAAINDQVRTAVAESDLVLVLVSATDGLTAADREAVQVARKRSKQAIVIVNKVDSQASAAVLGEFAGTGFDAVPVSAIHGRGTGDLLDLIVQKIGRNQKPAPNPVPAFTVVGRPNAGKSTLVNRLIGSESAVTSEVPHTTRDVTERLLKTPNGSWRLLDTAGMARKQESGVPYWSLLRTLRAIGESDVAVHLIDAVEGPTAQDAHIASHILESGTGLVLAINKWDLVDKSPDVQEKFFATLRTRLPFVPSPPVVFLSALTGEKADRLLRAVQDVYQASEKRVTTGELNRLVQGRLRDHAGGNRARLYYLTQTGTLPPTFACFVNQPDLWKDSQRRFLAGVLRDEFELYGAALRLEFRKSAQKETA